MSIQDEHRNWKTQQPLSDILLQQRNGRSLSTEGTRRVDESKNWGELRNINNGAGAGEEHEPVLTVLFFSVSPKDCTGAFF